VPDGDRERGIEYEYPEENEDGEETGQRQTPHDAHRFGFGFPVRGFVLKVNADTLALLWRP
jgi:hypothetical protein